MRARPGWAVVLGASTGAGAAIARSLARAPGLSIAGFHRGNHPGEAQRTEAIVRAHGRDLRWHLGDAGSADGVEAGIAQLAAALPRRSVRVFVHAIANASVGSLAEGLDGAGPRLHPRQFEKTFCSMAHSFVYWTRGLLDAGLAARGARFIALTNPNKDALLRGTGLIAAAKGALEVYVRYLAWELGPQGYRVNAVRYGATRTVALDRVLGQRGAAALSRRIQRTSPAGRMCTVDDVGAFASVLAGDECGWFNGAVIDFTGGETLPLYDMVLFGARRRRARRDPAAARDEAERSGAGR